MRPKSSSLNNVPSPYAQPQRMPRNRPTEPELGVELTWISDSDAVSSLVAEKS